MESKCVHLVWVGFTLRVVEKINEWVWQRQSYVQIADNRNKKENATNLMVNKGKY